MRDTLTGMIALHVALARMEGYQIDKKAARYNAMADYAIHCGRCTFPFNIDTMFLAITEAVSTAIVGDPMNIPGTPVNVDNYRWMEVSSERDMMYHKIESYCVPLRLTPTDVVDA